MGLHYQPVADTNTPIFQHHLLHHFLEEKIVKAKKGKRNKTIRGTPTLSFWKRKFSSKSLKLYETSKALEEDVVLKIYHVPYYLYTKKQVSQCQSNWAEISTIFINIPGI